MELIIIIIAIIASVVMSLIMRTKTEELKNIALDEKLNSISKKFPSNTEICKTILKQLGNESTKVEEDLKSEATIYVAIQDKISVGNTHESFTRIQTMAHECLHSVQDKKLLMFNFIYSNIYLILSFIYYVIKIFLENDAMIKAQYLAKEYMEKQECATEKDIEKIYDGFKQLNKGLIKSTNYNLFVGIMIKLVIFNALALIF